MENGLLYILAFSAMAIALFACVLPQVPVFGELSNMTYSDYIVDNDAAGNYWAANSTHNSLWYGTNASYTLNTAAAASNSLLEIRPGNYYLDTNFVLSGTVITVKGSGMDNTILNFDSGTGIVVRDHAPDHYHEISNLYLVGENTGTGLYLENVTRMSSYNLGIMQFSTGLYLAAGSLMNKFYSLTVRNCNIGVWINRNPGEAPYCDGNTFFGGSIFSNDKYGVKISGEITATKFYGCEIENNAWSEVNLDTIDISGDGYIPTLNIFDGCYFEAENTTEGFVRFTSNASRPARANVFRYCKFGMHQSTTLVVDGDSNHFEANQFTGSSKICNVTLTGSKIMFLDNYRINTGLTVSVDSVASGNVVSGNEFYQFSSTGGYVP